MYIFYIYIYAFLAKYSQGCRLEFYDSFSLFLLLPFSFLNIIISILFIVDSTFYRLVSTPTSIYIYLNISL